FRPLFLSLDWTGLDEDEDAHVWEDNWDDDNVEDDFSNQLRFSSVWCGMQSVLLKIFFLYLQIVLLFFVQMDKFSRDQFSILMLRFPSCVW
uniref:26S proteasome complex subunit SEM1 n=5 Tax=Aves TaxID=8782 RepID=A0A8C8BHL6_9STRI